MTIEEALKAYLLTHPSLTAKVGAKVYFMLADQRAKPPLVVISKISGNRHHELDFASPLLQVSYYDTDPERAQEGAEIIIAALKGYSGPMGSLFVSQGVYQNDLVLPQEDGVFQAPVDIRLSHREG